MVSRLVAELALGIEAPVYAWVITKDLLDKDDATNDVGRYGRHDAPQELRDRIAKGEGRRFRLVDDDGEVYCEGRMLYANEDDTENGPGSDWDFAPQNDYGEGGLGTTEIQYWKPGKGGGWETL